MLLPIKLEFENYNEIQTELNVNIGLMKLAAGLASSPSREVVPYGQRHIDTFYKHSLFSLHAVLIYKKSVVGFRKPSHGPSIDALKPNNSFQITIELPHLGRAPFSLKRVDLNGLKVPIYLQTVSPRYRITDERPLPVS